MWEPHLEKALEAARVAGDMQLEAFGRAHSIGFKGVTDLVTEVDRDCEQAITGILREAFPSHDFLLEESDPPRTGSPYLWVVDPLDGTTNYAHRYPHFCTSIALVHEDRAVVGVVLDPFRRELFSAARGGGAFLNEEPIRVSTEDRMIRCLLGTGFPNELRETEDTNLERFSRALFRSRGIRRSGSAALDLCYLAAGRLDGYWVIRLQPWDAAAGILLVEEAGGVVTDLAGAAPDLPRGGLVGTNGRIHAALLEILDGSSHAS